MEWTYNTGGRERYYKALNVRDCVTRAVAISNNMDYKKAYKLVWRFEGNSPRNGVSQTGTDNTFKSLGWKYKDVRAEHIRINDFKISNPNMVLRIKGHVVAVKDGVLNDTWNCSAKNPEIIGFWIKEN